MSRTFVMGDIHGAHKALQQCLERSGFDPQKDTLIQLGDVCDGYSYVKECVDILLGIPNLIALRGNHDAWFLKWMQTGSHPDNWLQGGMGVVRSYKPEVTQAWSGGLRGTFTILDIPESHRKFFMEQKLYYKDDQNRLFVHAGFNRHELVDNQPENVLCWDRDLWAAAMTFKETKYKFKMAGGYKEVFIGHTATVIWSTDKPMQAANIWNVDTGAGWNGKLTIMDVDTHEYWQSDLVSELYPGEKGR